MNDDQQHTCLASTAALVAALRQTEQPDTQNDTQTTTETTDHDQPLPDTDSSDTDTTNQPAAA